MARSRARAGGRVLRLVVAAAAFRAVAAPVSVESPIERLGSKTARLTRAHIRFEHTYWSRGRRTQVGTFDVWYDKGTGEYLAVDKWRTPDRPGAQRRWGNGVLVNKKGATTWYINQGDVRNCYRRAADPYLLTKDKLPVNNYTRGCVLDALFGYRNVVRVFTLRPAKPALPAGHDKLSWFSVQVKEGTPEADAGWLTQQDNQTSFGFDPQTGWLKAIVTKRPGSWQSATIVTDIRGDPDTKGVFVLPDELRDTPIIDMKTRQPIPPDER